VIDLHVGPGTNPDVVNLEARFDTFTAPGLEAQVPWLTLGVAGASDSRDQADLPTQGLFAAAALWQLRSLDGSSQAITRGAIDVRLFEPVVSGRQVVAVRLLGSVDQVSDDSRTPFYLQYWLGGSHTLRGYSSYRFRGQSVVHLSAELRWRVARMVDLVPFVDVGTAADTPGALWRSTFLASKGLGVWLRDDDSFYVRIDWAHGGEGHRVLWSLSPSF
jgi:outer membrane protein assembly factor BamA